MRSPCHREWVRLSCRQHRISEVADRLLSSAPILPCPSMSLEKKAAASTSQALLSPSPPVPYRRHTSVSTSMSCSTAPKVRRKDFVMIPRQSPLSHSKPSTGLSPTPNPSIQSATTRKYRTHSRTTPPRRLEKSPPAFSKYTVDGTA